MRDLTVFGNSGHSVLDDSAVAKVRSIALPLVPDELRDLAFSIRVPFRFQLRTGKEPSPGDAGLAPNESPDIVLPERDSQ